MSDAKADAAFDALDNWYENAIKQGMGFKNEKERQDYIASLGDPMKHPLFAEDTEDLEGHPLTEAFRVLREEDKTLVELALLYKEEGNDWVKKNTKKSFSEAYDRYSHAITFLDKADKARLAGTECIPDQNVNLKEVRSQIMSNRALASLRLLNFGSCVKDCSIAIDLCPQNLKAHYRKCKALIQLKKYTECLDACKEGLLCDSENKELLALKQQAEENLEATVKAQTVQQQRTLDALIKKWNDVWDLAKSQQATLSYPILFTSTATDASFADLAQLRDAWPHIDADSFDTAVKWPMLLRYPQYNTHDVIVAAGNNDMIAEHLALAFPEKEDDEQQYMGSSTVSPNSTVPWDIADEYHVSNLIVYIELRISSPITSRENWLRACMEYWILAQGGDIRLYALMLRQQSLSSTTATSAGNEIQSIEGLREQVKRREQQYEKQKMEIRSKVLSSNHSNIVTTSSSTSKPKPIVHYLEVQLGNTIEQIARAAEHMLPRGVITLLVFPRSGQSHREFVAENKLLIAKL